ncbi:MAG: endolytic transglycosylase MltG [Kangiellaceae bacterium]|jgi:UPF0755 protein|nr:endolytic transglycosylase MltG [Kangiellaceae bacterium]
MKKLVFNLVKFAFIAAWFFVAWQLFILQTIAQQPVALKSEIELSIAAGDTVNSLVDQLVEDNQIEHKWLTKLFIKINPNLQNIKVGKYLISPPINLQQLLVKLVDGEQIQYRLSIIEGLTVKQVFESIKRHPNITSTIESSSLLPQVLGSSYSHPEGLLFADTYQFPDGYTDKQLVMRSYKKLLSVLDEEWQRRQPDLPYSSPYQALIMASIIEKETAVAKERTKIAGVFVRRLKKNMRLQTDPTVIYGVGESYAGDITRKHLKTDTPYNTYTRHGLPPTPIAIVGRESIHAALNPDDGTALYFVATGDGGHYFSDTLQQHQAAVQRYLLRSKN